MEEGTKKILLFSALGLTLAGLSILGYYKLYLPMQEKKKAAAEIKRPAAETPIKLVPTGAAGSGGGTGTTAPVKKTT